MSKSLDEEWLAGCLPHALELIEEALVDPSHLTRNVNALIAASAEIKALQLQVKMYSKRIDELSSELEALIEPEEDNL